MSTRNARAHFRNHRKGENFMTPEIIRYGWIRMPDVSYELSRGTGIFTDDLYGVTLSSPPDTAIGKLSDCFDSREAAEELIQTLRDWNATLPTIGVQATA